MSYYLMLGLKIPGVYMTNTVHISTPVDILMQSVFAVCAPKPQNSGYRLRLAKTAKTFYGCFGVLFWLK